MRGNVMEGLIPPSQKVVDIRVRRVLDALQQSPRYGLRELATLVHLSASRLSRLFKSETGVGLGEYVAELRMRHAASLLAATEEPVKCVASAVGYHHSSSFVRAFNSRFSENPKAYRHKMQLSTAALK
jgi:transcriptional regulator GlxA family with amidase domain